MFRYIGLLRDRRVWVVLLVAFVIRGGASWYLDARMAEEGKAEAARIAAMTPEQRAQAEAEQVRALGSFLGVELPTDPAGTPAPVDTGPAAEKPPSISAPSAREAARTFLGWVPVVAAGGVFLGVLGVGGGVAWRLSRTEEEDVDEDAGSDDGPAPPSA